jgi:hypothetical protein
MTRLRSITSWQVAAVLAVVVAALAAGVITGVLPLDRALAIGRTLIMGG